MHTPLTISTTCDHKPAIADARGINIASWDPATIELFDDVRPDIVNAVNSYEAMREALKGAQNDINFHGGKLSGGTIDAIKKAFTLAEGKEPS